MNGLLEISGLHVPAMFHGALKPSSLQHLRTVMTEYAQEHGYDECTLQLEFCIIAHSSYAIAQLRYSINSPHGFFGSYGNCYFKRPNRGPFPWYFDWEIPETGLCKLLEDADFDEASQHLPQDENIEFEVYECGSRVLASRVKLNSLRLFEHWNA